jgi:hypothetical protein
MAHFSVQLVPVKGLIGTLEELHRLGEIRRVLESASIAFDLAVRKSSTDSSKTEEKWLEFPKDILESRVLRDAIDSRISALLELVRTHYKIDLCNDALVMSCR